MYLSPYQISTYRQCPLKYRLQYVDGLGDEFIKPRSYFSFGKSIHTALRDFYRLGGPTKNPFSLLFSLYRNQWQGIDPVKEGYGDRDEAEDYYYRGYYMLQNYYQEHEGERGETLSLEEHLTGEILPGITLGGRIDRLAKTPDGWVEIIDYKTGKYVPAEEDVKEDIQPAIYYYLVKKTLKAPLIRVKLYYLFKKKTLLLEEISLGEEDLKELALSLQEELEKNIYPAHKNRFCPNCDFQLLCPKMLEEQKKMGPRNRERIKELARGFIYDSPILYLTAALLAIQDNELKDGEIFLGVTAKRREELSKGQTFLFLLKRAELYLKQNQREEAKRVLLELQPYQDQQLEFPGTDYLLEYLQIALCS